MGPEHGDRYPHPVACKLHEGELGDIKATVKEIDGKLDRWFGPEGTVWNLKDEVANLRSSAERAHERIDDAQIEIRANKIAHEDTQKELTTLGRKVAVIVAVPTVVALILGVLGYLGG